MKLSFPEESGLKMTEKVSGTNENPVFGTRDATAEDVRNMLVSKLDGLYEAEDEGDARRKWKVIGLVEDGDDLSREDHRFLKKMWESIMHKAQLPRKWGQILDAIVSQEFAEEKKEEETNA